MFSWSLPELLPGDGGRAVVADGDLDADALLNENDIPPDGAGDGGGGVLVSAGEAEAGQTLLPKGLCLGHQALHRAGGAVGAQQAHQRGDARLDRGAEPQGRDLVGKAALTAAAGDVYVLVDIAGDGPHTPAVQDLQPGQPAVQPVVHGGDALVGDEKLRGLPGAVPENADIFDELDHTVVPFLQFV